MTNPIPVVSAILVNRRGEVLMQLRDDDPAIEYPSHWTLPGGYVEAGESPEQAIHRELAEEMELTDLTLTHIGAHLAQRGPDGSVTVHQHLFTGPLDRSTADTPLHEGQRLAWVPPPALDTLPIAFDHRQTLERFFFRR